MIGFLLLAGCSQLIDGNMAEPVQKFKDPETNQPYLLYRPSGYDPKKNWPLMVVCSSSFPDSPNKRIQDWAALAESRGFLVLAPTMRATTGTFAPKTAKQLPQQREDERHLLAAIQHVRAGHSVSDDRVFLQGYGSGATSALYTGLKHPDLFRAIDLSDPKFHASCLGEVAERVDPHQPVQVHYRITDKILGSHGKNCEDWLRSHGADLREDRPGPSDPGDALGAVGFFEDVLRTVPWMQLRVRLPDPNRPRELKFKLDCSFTPTQYQWDFGDGQTSPIAEPMHAYAQPGTYRATVTVHAGKSAQHRFRDVVVP